MIGIVGVIVRVCRVYDCALEYMKYFHDRIGIVNGILIV